MKRGYEMRKRAEARERTRERILRASMAVHDEQGVAPTTFADIARRAGVSQATISRHFPKLGDLIQACGMHVWIEMQPPIPDAARTIFAGIETTHECLVRLVEELNAFYSRGALRLRLAARDRDLVPELDGFLTAVEAGVEAFVREALTMAEEPERAVQVAIRLMSFPVWQELNRLGLPASELAAFKVRLLECGIRAAHQA
jgi:AcrR family transcriptional regulator